MAVDNPSSAPNLCSFIDPRATYDFTRNRTYLTDFVDSATDWGSDYQVYTMAAN